jgi:hypothetical protein
MDEVVPFEEEPQSPACEPLVVDLLERGGQTRGERGEGIAR